MTQIYTDIVFTHLIIFSDFRPEPVFLNLYPRVIFELFYSFLRAIFELGQKLWNNPVHLNWAQDSSVSNLILKLSSNVQ